MSDNPIATLISVLEDCQTVAVLTGAGCSTESGIPDYRDVDGEWKHRPPVQYQDFVASHAMRQRYWARSMIGWQRVAIAQPNPAHTALARLEHASHVHRVITQNIDGLHQQAGSRAVIDLHGRLSRVVCLACGSRVTREAIQQRLVDMNPDWQRVSAAEAPDGDALLDADFRAFRIAECEVCDGVLKPDVVFFGESVPAERARDAMDAVATADALLVAGTSLMVWSGLRFVRAAAERGIPVALINLGRTRADELFTHRVIGRCSEILSELADRLHKTAGTAH